MTPTEFIYELYYDELLIIAGKPHHRCADPEGLVIETIMAMSERGKTTGMGWGRRYLRYKLWADYALTRQRKLNEEMWTHHRSTRSPTPIEVLLDKEFTELLGEAKATLSDREQIAFAIYHEAGLSTHNGARHLGWSRDKFYRALVNAEAKIYHFFLTKGYIHARKNYKTPGRRRDSNSSHLHGRRRKAPAKGLRGDRADGTSAIGAHPRNSNAGLSAETEEHADGTGGRQ